MKTTLTKQNISLYVAHAYINALSDSAPELLKDKKYSTALNALKTRIYELLETPGDGDLIDIYVVVECAE